MKITVQEAIGALWTIFMQESIGYKPKIVKFSESMYSHCVSETINQGKHTCLNYEVVISLRTLHTKSPKINELA